MKIYTKTGDAGQTGLFGGRRVSKAHIRIEAYGVVDKLNAQLGVVRHHLADTSAGLAEIDAVLHRIQSELFVLGADLATPLEVESSYIPRVDEEQIARLEREIDQFDAALSPLQSFILPGGSGAAAYLHLARTTCREAERATVHLSTEEPINHHALIYLNRLSDWLFTVARYANERQGVADVPWVSPAQMARQSSVPAGVQNGSNGKNGSNGHGH